MVKIGLGVTAGCDMLAPARCAPSLAVSCELALAECGVVGNGGGGGFARGVFVIGFVSVSVLECLILLSVSTKRALSETECQASESSCGVLAVEPARCAPSLAEELSAFLALTQCQIENSR